MRFLSRYLLAACAMRIFLRARSGAVPAAAGSRHVVKDALSINSVNGVLDAEFTMRHSVDTGGYNHYCFNYDTAQRRS